MDKIKLIGLGGFDEVYKNMLIVEINEDIFVVEAGIKFPDKTKPGIDYVMPRIDYLVENKNRVRGYFLTHGHDSMIGAIPYIYKTVPAPIYCTDITKVFLLSFCEHNHISAANLVFNIVQPSQNLKIANRVIRLFSTCCSFAQSFGISFDTDQGNIVILSNFVIDNNNDIGFLMDTKKLSSIAENETIVLLIDSMYADKSGYTNPTNKLVPLITKTVKDAQGRLLIGIDAPDIYNIIQTIKLCIKFGRKLIIYDQSTRDLIGNLLKSGQLSLSKENIASIDDVNRIRPQDVFILMTGFGKNLYSKIALLATHNNDCQLLKIDSHDTFIVAGHVNNDTELALTDALNELYRNDCKIVHFNKNELIRGHGSEEDIKTIISLLKPKYYIPMSGTFQKLLANAKIALGMNVGLNHSNVFVIDNGVPVIFENGKASISPNKIICGDLLIDGKGIGDVMSNVIEERQKISDDGIVILAATISKSQRTIVGGPDVQTRGLIFVKTSDALVKEINRCFILSITQELAKDEYSISNIEKNTQELVLKSIRRTTLKSPIIVPIVVEID